MALSKISEDSEHVGEIGEADGAGAASLWPGQEAEQQRDGHDEDVENHQADEKENLGREPNA